MLHALFGSQALANHPAQLLNLLPQYQVSHLFLITHTSPLPCHDFADLALHCAFGVISAATRLMVMGQPLLRASLVQRASGRVRDERESLEGIGVVKGESDACCKDGEGCLLEDDLFEHIHLQLQRVDHLHTHQAASTSSEACLHQLQPHDPIILPKDTVSYLLTPTYHATYSAGSSKMLKMRWLVGGAGWRKGKEASMAGCSSLYIQISMLFNRIILYNGGTGQWARQDESVVELISQLALPVTVALLTLLATLTLLLHGVQIGLVAVIPCLVHLLQSHVKHHLRCELLEQRKQVGSVSLAPKRLRGQSAGRLRQEEGCVAHETEEVLGSPIEVGSDQVISVSAETSIRTSPAVIDKTKTGCFCWLRVDSLKRVAGCAALHEDHCARLEISIHRHFQLLLLLLYICNIDGGLKGKHLLAVLLACQLFTILLFQSQDLLVYALLHFLLLCLRLGKDVSKVILMLLQCLLRARGLTRAHNKWRSQIS